MIRYIINRIIFYIPTLLVILFLVFLMIRSVPGDPIRVMYGEHEPPPEVRKVLEERLGLDKPIYAQFLLYLKRILVDGDWGKSVSTGEPVLQMILTRFRATLELTVVSIAIAATIGIGLALLSVYKLNSIIDKCVRIVSIASYSLPVFWWGLILILIFAVNLGILPPGGRGTPMHLVLPSITLAIANFGMFARVSRASMLDVLVQDFVVVGKAKGLSDKALLIFYILRNASIPIATVVGLRFGVLMGGAVITETVFNYPGVGKMIYDAILSRDYPVIFGGVLFIAIVVMTVNLAVDLAYYSLDPRVRLEKKVE
ncbi:MAG: ABC transporter permease [Ignisphaera sp.]